jgi:DNA polymerase-3 subunit beta
MFKIKSKLFFDGVAFVASAVAKNGNPILQNIKITLNENGLSLNGQNSHFNCNYNINIVDIDKVGKYFSTTVPAIKLLDILKKTNNDVITCKFITKGDSEFLAVFTQNSKFLLHCLDVNSYPTSKKSFTDDGFTLKANDILQAIKQVEHAICTDEARFYINGILLDFSTDNKITIVATDSHRLAIANIERNTNNTLQNIIIPRQSITKIKELLSIAKDDNVTININKTKIQIEYQNCNIISGLIEGEFPPYKRVIPQNFINTIQINKNDLQKAIDTVSSIYSGSNYNVIRMQIVNQNKITVIADKKIIPNSNIADNVGIAKHDITCQTNIENGVILNYNFKYITDVLSSLNSPDCLIKITEPTKPCVITSFDKNTNENEEEVEKKEDVKENEEEDDALDSTLFIVMPIKV